MIIAVDFDGTIVDHVFPEIGAPVPGALEWLRRFKELGATLILWTVRSDDAKAAHLTAAAAWCRERGVPFDHVNGNPGQASWSTSPKAYAHIYIDDAAAGCPLRDNPRMGGRPFVDWDKVGPVVERALLADARPPRPCLHLGAGGAGRGFCGHPERPQDMPCHRQNCPDKVRQKSDAAWAPSPGEKGFVGDPGGSPNCGPPERLTPPDRLLSCPQPICQSMEVGVAHDWRRGEVCVECLDCGFRGPVQKAGKGSCRAAVAAWNAIERPAPGCAECLGTGFLPIGAGAVPCPACRPDAFRKADDAASGHERKEEGR